MCSLETLPRELKECCRELEPSEEEFDIFFVEAKVWKKDKKKYKMNED